MTDTANRPHGDLDTAHWNIVQNVELLDIRIVRWTAELRDYHAKNVEGFDPDFSVDFRFDSETMQLRWAFDTTLRSVTGRPVAELGLTLIQLFAFTDPDTRFELGPELMHEFAEKTAVISIIPFVREAVQTMTVRLGLPPVTLGLMKAGSSGPQSFNVRG